MVAGAYTKSSHSRSRPVVLKYPPSHAERPQGRGMREKGKGWQRSKSSIYDYGSDFYFSEEKSSHHRRAQSSMSGRKTDRHSSLYDVEPRKRRASVEALVKSARPEVSVKSMPSAPTGPPTQKRLLTINDTPNERDTLSPNRAIIGHTDIRRDRAMLNPMVKDIEGPPARQRTVRREVVSLEPIAFPYADEPVKKERVYDPKYRLMETLVTTETFKERLNKPIGEEVEYQTSDLQPYNKYSKWPVEDSHEFLTEMRLELMENEVPENRILSGRVFFNLKKAANIESIQIDINKTLAKTTIEGDVYIDPIGGRGSTLELRLLPNRRAKLAISQDPSQVLDPSHPPPNDFEIIETIPKAIKLSPGANSIPFDIYVPDNQIPTFIFVSTDGKTVVNNYSAEAVVRVGNTVEKTGRVSITVPAIGTRKEGYVDSKKDYDLMVFNKYFDDKEGFDYVVGYHSNEFDRERREKLQVNVIRTVRCPKINPKGWIDVVRCGTPTETSPKNNEVLARFQEGARTQGKVPKNEWDYCRGNTDNFIPFTTPTVTAGDFSCEYQLELIIDNVSLRGPIIKCDRLEDRRIIRNDIGVQSRREDFKST